MVLRRPWTLSRRGPGLLGRAGHDESSGSVRQGHRGVARGRVVGERPGAEGDLGPHPLGRPPFDRRTTGGGGHVPAREVGSPWSSEGQAGRFDHRLPTRAPAQVSQQGLVDLGVGNSSGRIVAGVAQRGEPHDDAGGAEPALAGAGGSERGSPGTADSGGQTVQRGHLAAGQPAYRGHARHPGCAVDPHGATTALALRAAAVLRRAQVQALAQHVEQRLVVLGHLDVDAVDAEPDQRIS